MTFTARPADQIRDAYLADKRARYLARGDDLDVSQDGDEWVTGAALALQLEGLEAKAASDATQVFPDEATPENLAHHATVDGVARKGATYARRNLTVTGTPGAAYATTDLLNAADGTQFAPVAGGTLVGTSATVLVEARTAGAAGNKSTGSILTWQSPPTGINSTAAVSVTTTGAVTGADEESDAAWAGRIIARRRERPAGGNRADVRAWGEDFPQVAAAFVYPLYHPTLGAGTYGAWTLVVLGAGAARVLTSGDAADVAARIEGTYALAGEALAQRRPVTMAPADYDVRVAAPQTQAVVAQLVLATGYAWPASFTAPHAVAATPASTTTRVYLAADPTTAGTGRVAVNEYVAVKVAGARGGYEARRVVATNAAGVSPFYLDLDPTTPLAAAPATAAAVRPAFAGWQSARDNVLAIYDNLGPGDTSPASRWPPPSETAPAVLYKSAVTAALMGTPGLAGAPAGASGVASANVTTPATDVTPAAFGLVVPGDIYFTA